MSALSAAERAFLENAYVGVITVLRPDGSPHSTVVWVDVDEDGVSFNTARPRAKPRYLDADPRVSLVVVDPNDELRWLALTGTATLVDEGANEQIDRLARKYRDHDRYMSHREGETRVSVVHLAELRRVTRDRVGTPNGRCNAEAPHQRSGGRTAGAAPKPRTRAPGEPLQRFACLTPRGSNALVAGWWRR